MKSLVCNYAIARFLPYRDTGEFVNVGIVVACPEAGAIRCRFEDRKYRRITAFFPELDIEVYWAAQKAVQLELNRVGNAFFELFGAPAYGAAQERQCLDAFREIIRPREALFKFSEPGSLMARSADEAVTKLFEKYVERQFAKSREYQELVMRDKLAAFLDEWKLDTYYVQDRKVGNADYHRTFPFVNLGQRDVVRKAIKPLDLDKGETSEIYRHGDDWISVVRRLKKIDCMPQKLIFAVRNPAAKKDDKKSKAADEIGRELAHQGATIVPFEAREIKVVASISEGLKESA